MPSRPCPFCGDHAPRFLPASSDGSAVNYYRCDSCNHVWHVKKTDSGARQVPVTNRRHETGEGEGGGQDASG